MCAFLAFIIQQRQHLLLVVGKECSMFTTKLTDHGYIFHIYQGNAIFLLVELMWLDLLLL
jgi:hypothetical protein